MPIRVNQTCSSMYVYTGRAVPDASRVISCMTSGKKTMSPPALRLVLVPLPLSPPLLSTRLVLSPIDPASIVPRLVPPPQVPPELMVVKAQLSKKYGKSLVVKAEKNEGGCVDKCVATRLSFQADPSPLLVKVTSAQLYPPSYPILSYPLSSCCYAQSAKIFVDGHGGSGPDVFECNSTDNPRAIYISRIPSVVCIEKPLRHQETLPNTCVQCYHSPSYHISSHFLGSLVVRTNRSTSRR